MGLCLFANGLLTLCAANRSEKVDPVARLEAGNVFADHLNDATAIRSRSIRQCRPGGIKPRTDICIDRIHAGRMDSND